MLLRQRFHDRMEAGRALADELVRNGYSQRDDLIVLALPRGGVLVAYEVAQALDAPLDVFVVRKLGVPGQEELAMGAIAAGGIRVLNEEVISILRIPQEVIEHAVQVEQAELERRVRDYRGDRPPAEVRGKTVLLIDDGLATGSTMRAAATALRQRQPAQIVVAVPVAAAETCEKFREEVDDVICAATPEPFRAVGLWYENFPQTSDREVLDLLHRAWENEKRSGPT